jgi:hypothetical protein
MIEDKRKYQGPPEIAPEPTPHITPEMVQKTFKVLETKGMIYYSEGGAYVPTEKGWKLLMKAEYENEEIIAHGHIDINPTNSTDILITKSQNPNGNSTIAVKANKACDDLGSNFKKSLKSNESVRITIDADDIVDEINAFGSPVLKLTDKEKIVITKNDSIDDATIAIMADKAAIDLKRDLVDKLKDPNVKVKITFEIK